MSFYKLLTTRLGDFTVHTLDIKAKPFRILSRAENERAQHELVQALREKEDAEQVKMKRLNDWVILWVRNNLDETARDAFFTALGQQRYSDAHRVLIDTFHTNGRVKFTERNRFDRWLANFDHGFRYIC